jgi:crotonobetainyl-CoA:carnitine CoA-transferase CaiB-like acyl-CoA transferase
MAGGGLFMILGVLAGVLCARETGVGQVVDAAIVDGSAVLYTLLSALQKSGAHSEPAGKNILDGGRYYYRT